MGADTVITMLPAGAPVRAVYADSIVPHAEKGALVIDCSTIDVESARDVAAQAAAAGLRPVDAPVSGGTAGAEAGTLTFMVEARDDKEPIGDGSHQRVVVNVARFDARLQRKLES